MSGEIMNGKGVLPIGLTGRREVRLGAVLRPFYRTCYRTNAEGRLILVWGGLKETSHYLNKLFSALDAFTCLFYHAALPSINQLIVHYRNDSARLVVSNAKILA